MLFLPTSKPYAPSSWLFESLPCCFCFINLPSGCISPGPVLMICLANLLLSWNSSLFSSWSLLKWLT